MINNLDQHSTTILEVVFINGSDQSVNLSNEVVKYNHIRPTYLYFTINYQNIKASFFNNKFYADTAGTILITISDGLYDYPQINNAYLELPLSGGYYHIQKRLDGNGFGIY